MDIIYISKNEDKFKESKRLFVAELANLKEKGIEINANLVRMNENSIDEIQTDDIDKLLDDKIKRAYKIYKRPVLVDHTTLNIDCLNGYPNSQTSEFWNTICKRDEEHGNKRGKLLCTIIDKLAHNDDIEIEKKSKKAIAKTIYCYCNGKNIIKVKTEVEGFISREPRGNSKFQWDVIFIPYDEEAQNKTFAELSMENIGKNHTKKDLFSMRAKAMKKFANELNHNFNEFDYNIGINSNHIRDIANSIIEKKLVVFVGSGVSESIGMAGWSKLTEDLAKELQFDNKDIFTSLGDNLELSEYYSLEKSNYVKQIVKYFKNHISIAEIEKKIRNSIIYKIIANLNIDTIYTTNYEDVIERAFNIHNPSRNYYTMYDLETLNKSKASDVEIVKLHGDLNKPEGIVLTQTSYYKRFDFEDCLDIKLRNDLLTKSVLFIGYSFSDSNIKYMMHKLNSTWEGQDMKCRPKSYIFLTENNPVQRKIIEKNNNMITIVTENLDKTKALEEFLIKIEKVVSSKN